MGVPLAAIGRVIGLQELLLFGGTALVGAGAVTAVGWAGLAVPGAVLIFVAIRGVA